MLELLRGDAGLGMGAAVEGPAASEATAVREAAETPALGITRRGP
jgi:hypothetical protein